MAKLFSKEKKKKRRAREDKRKLEVIWNEPPMPIFCSDNRLCNTLTGVSVLGLYRPIPIDRLSILTRVTHYMTNNQYYFIELGSSVNTALLLLSKLYIDKN